MRGLLEKDIRLLLKRKKYFLLVAVIAVALSFQMTGSFIVSYLTMVGMILSLSTISYDEVDNGLPFLMTLPITRREYAMEKYLFGFCGLTLSWILGVVLQILMMVVRGTGVEVGSLLLESLLYLGLFLSILAILIPIELHFGVEKSRIAMVVIFGVCFAVATLGTEIAGMLSIDPEQVVKEIASIPKAVLVMAGVCITILVAGISLLIAMKDMERREF